MNSTPVSAYFFTKISTNGVKENDVEKNNFWPKVKSWVKKSVF